MEADTFQEKEKKGKLRKEFEKEKCEMLWLTHLMMKYYGLQLASLIG